MTRIFISAPLCPVEMSLDAGGLERLEAAADLLVRLAPEWLLRRDRRTDVEAADLEAGLDARRERILLEQLVDPPERLLQLECLVPPPGAGQVVQPHAGGRHHAGRPGPP